MKDLHPVAQMRADPLFGPLTNFLAVCPLQQIVLNDVNAGVEQAFALNQFRNLSLAPEQLTRFRQSKGAVVVGEQLLNPVFDFLDHHAPGGGEHRSGRTVQNRRVGREDQALDMPNMLAFYGDCAFLGINLCVQL